MDTKAVIELVDELQENLEDLEDNLGSIPSGSLAATSRKLPLLDRAKLNVLLVYSIESLLFSYLKLHGAQVKEHPVFKELTRVRQYFEKIKSAEAGPTSARPTVTLNKEAATRVIKHGLAGDEKYDLERAEREAREKVLANRKLRSLESKMKEKAAENSNDGEDTTMNDALAQAAQLAAAAPDQPADDAVDSDSDTGSESDEEGEVAEETRLTRPGKKRKRRPNRASRKAKQKGETGFSDQKDEEQMEDASVQQAEGKAKGKKKKKKAKKAPPPPS
ncbi:hypothetical protein H2200_007058 [Cladophialophora chaetospira]|uniref:Exosome complex protein n=1 Tax=Cladophialophora chaetospira TaxID=386627 RepID=A0AA38X731_9EURO|nr:hypothetical protein H2200_007058 [Cladophialophora chaetospira]